MTEVARLYRFRGRHHVPSLPAPWCKPHEHDYTIEVVARGESPIVVDTDLIDAAWERAFSTYATLADLAAIVPTVCRVVVWEDRDRWGSAGT